MNSFVTYQGSFAGTTIPTVRLAMPTASLALRDQRAWMSWRPAWGSAPILRPAGHSRIVIAGAASVKGRSAKEI
jgi:hypothetical protein